MKHNFSPEQEPQLEEVDHFFHETQRTGEVVGLDDDFDGEWEEEFFCSDCQVYFWLQKSINGGVF